MDNIQSPYKKIYESAVEVVKEAGEFLKEKHKLPRAIRHKGRIDLVTDTDVAMEELLKKKLHNIVPEADFLAEESASSYNVPETCWIIDPIDGTTNFVHGLPIVAISVAYYDKGEVQFGVVNTPLIDECFYACKGQGAFCNGEPISVSNTDAMEQSLLATGFPYAIQQNIGKVLSRMEKALLNSQGVRRCGASAVDMSWVACGRFEAYFEEGVKPWDIAAASCIVVEAGGKVTLMDGSPFSFELQQCLASNGLIHNGVVELLKETL